MRTDRSEPVFHYRNVLGQTPPAIWKLGAMGDRDVSKPEGFRIPLIYFSWGILQGSRTIHHHPDNDELLVVLEGEATVRLYSPGKPKDRFEGVFEVSAGDVVLFPQGWPHSAEEKGPVDSLKVMVLFNNQDFKAVEDAPVFELPESPEAHLGENA